MADIPQTVSIDSTVTPAPTQPVQPPQDNEVSMSKWFYIAGGIFLVLFVIFGLWFVFGTNKTVPVSKLPTPTPAMENVKVSGIVTMEGYFPPDAYIAIAERLQGKTSFKDVISGIIPSQAATGSSFLWPDANSGGNYEIKATLKEKGVEIDESPVTLISAPASGIDLHIVSDLKPPSPVAASISGTVQVSGYTPTGSYLEILAKKDGTSNYSTIANTITPTANAPWSWNGAISGTTYLVKAKLHTADGTTVATSPEDTATAPSTEEAITLLSPLTQPTPAMTGLSGTVTINGNIPANSYITLGTRPTGSTTFNQVASNISATNGVSWSWNGATTGSQQDVQAYLWTNSKPYAQSQIVTVTAPATNTLLTINAQVAIGQPAGNTITVTCNAQQNNLFQTTINFNTQGNLSGAQSYQLNVTQASTGSQVVGTTVNPGNPGGAQSITTNYLFTPGATYYASYAYATSVGGQMSPMSPSFQFSCQ